jgi:hypothetical protein
LPIDIESSIPAFDFLLSSESNLLKKVDDPSNCQAFCFDSVCPQCHTQPVEVYVDRLLEKNEILVFFETELSGRMIVAEVLSKLVIHELVHWAGGNETAADNAVELVEDFLVNGNLWKMTMQEERRFRRSIRE